MVSGLLDSPGVLAHEELNISFGIIPDYLSPVLYLVLDEPRRRSPLRTWRSTIFRWWYSRMVGCLAHRLSIWDGPRQMYQLTF